MIGLSLEQRVKDGVLSQEEYYVAGVMLGLGFLRYDENKKFRVLDMLTDPITDEEKAMQQRYHEKAFGADWKPTDIFWIEEENSPLGAQQVRHLIYVVQCEIAKKNWIEDPIANNEIFQRVVKIEIEFYSIESAREEIRKLAKQMEQGYVESAFSYFHEPEAFRPTKGNFASMDRKRIYRQNHNPKHTRMSQYKNYRRKM
ncbi:hypothetical protein HOU08_gp066 [Dickeya phage vB_DsoM_JA29]|uniref:Uncharacterized protein n=1 Tax=Dickeya phage vB_DsoM_JA29 TaxID=2283031 RepID=A0A384ZX21_9CAUD|nr:hypothetical protein HOU08_gp066 [Dickeya phage vB_DsoM_JA29]AXG66792.1 hypothetical protein JA29_066 [Dickeya phage vB_DsoM_JA29]